MDTKEARIFIVIIITAIVLGVIIAYFVISMVRQQKRNLALQKAFILAEISAMEKERTRIAADLHDELGPLLSVIKFQVDYVNSTVSQSYSELAKASEQLDGLIEQIREIANNLMPSALHRKGLITALEEYIGKVESTGKLHIEFEYPADPGLREEVSIQVYRALQEIIHNCIKHAGAKKLIIHIKKEQGMVTILCRDDGKGFDYDAVSIHKQGLGLSSLRNRTMMLGGKITIESKPGKGTAFLLELPIQEKA